jgi:hypothetical protein
VPPGKESLQAVRLVPIIFAGMSSRINAAWRNSRVWIIS